VSQPSIKPSQIKDGQFVKFAPKSPFEPIKGKVLVNDITNPIAVDSRITSIWTYNPKNNWICSIGFSLSTG